MYRENCICHNKKGKADGNCALSQLLSLHSFFKLLLDLLVFVILLILMLDRSLLDGFDLLVLMWEHVPLTDTSSVLVLSFRQNRLNSREVGVHASDPRECEQNAESWLLHKCCKTVHAESRDSLGELSRVQSVV